MKFQIVTDSASDLTDDYIVDSEIGFKVAPLTIKIGDKEYIDEKGIDVDKMLENMSEYEGKSTTSCPSPQTFFDAFMQADNTFCVTISSGMSGSYNSAVLAANMAKEQGKNVYVLDSKSVAGAQILIVDELYRLIKENEDFDTIVKKIDWFTKKRSLLFMLNKFDNLIKNGRMNKLAATIASLFSVKPICAASEQGDISMVEKVVGEKKALKRFIDKLLNNISQSSEKVIIITQCKAQAAAEKIKEYVTSIYKDVVVRIVETKGLTSYYALEGGILVSV